jgi:trehalose 6-phosphate phosphatase
VAADDLLVPLRANPARAGILTDFDGTLSPIVSDPGAAAPLDGALDVVAALAARFARVAIVSGRPVAFLRRWLEGTGVVLSGLYGLELAMPGEDVSRHPDAERWRLAVEDVASRTESAGPDLYVERKGLTVTLHYRTTPEQEALARAWAEAEAARTGLALHEARKSFELSPPLGLDKGAVVAELAAGLDAVLFAGDDLGDVAAFDALDRLSSAGCRAVRVGVRSAEAPPELLARADLVVDGPPDVVALLRSLL